MMAVDFFLLPPRGAVFGRERTLAGRSTAPSLSCRHFPKAPGILGGPARHQSPDGNPNGTALDVLPPRPGESPKRGKRDGVHTVRAYVPSLREGDKFLPRGECIMNTTGQTGNGTFPCFDFAPGPQLLRGLSSRRHGEPV